MLLYYSMMDEQFCRIVGNEFCPYFKFDKLCLLLIGYHTIPINLPIPYHITPPCTPVPAVPLERVHSSICHAFYDSHMVDPPVIFPIKKDQVQVGS